MKFGRIVSQVNMHRLQLTSKFNGEPAATSSTSPYQFEPGRSRSDCICRLLCQKTVEIYHILPMLFLSTLAQKLLHC